MKKAFTPVFEPMGIEKENWPASVSIFTGLFAKEAVVGTLNSLYGQMNEGTASKADEAGKEAAAQGKEQESPYSLWGGMAEAFATLPDNLSGVLGGLTDPFGFGAVSGDENAVAKELDADLSVFTNMRARFTKGPHQAFAHLLFILLYVPCMAAMGAAYRELGRGYGTLLMGYLTVLGWCVATLYYQFVLGHQTVWILTAGALLAVMFGSFWLLGRVRKIPVM